MKLLLLAFSVSLSLQLSFKVKVRHSKFNPQDNISHDQSPLRQADTQKLYNHFIGLIDYVTKQQQESNRQLDYVSRNGERMQQQLRGIRDSIE